MPAHARLTLSRVYTLRISLFNPGSSFHVNFIYLFIFFCTLNHRNDAIFFSWLFIHFSFFSALLFLIFFFTVKNTFFEILNLIVVDVASSFSNDIFCVCPCVCVCVKYFFSWWVRMSGESSSRSTDKVSSEWWQTWRRTRKSDVNIAIFRALTPRWLNVQHLLFV